MTWQATWNSLGGDLYKFNIGAYNPIWPLIIEIDEANASPSTASTNNSLWQTYIGGNKDDRMMDMRIDSLGNIYTLMYTNSTIFQTYPNFVTVATEKKIDIVEAGILETIKLVLTTEKTLA